MKKIFILATLITSQAFGHGVSVMQDGTIHCRGCRFKTINGVQYVCTGSIANETCTEREQWIKNVKAPKQMNNEDMSYLRETREREATPRVSYCLKDKWNWRRMEWEKITVECE